MGCRRVFGRAKTLLGTFDQRPRTFSDQAIRPCTPRCVLRKGLGARQVVSQPGSQPVSQLARQPARIVHAGCRRVFGRAKTLLGTLDHCPCTFLDKVVSPCTPRCVLRKGSAASYTEGHGYV